jgi:hypothetical protein
MLAYCSDLTVKSHPIKYEGSVDLTDILFPLLVFKPLLLVLEAGFFFVLQFYFTSCVSLFVVQLDRTRLAREKQLREEAVKEKEELERRMLHLQEEVRLAQDSLVCGRVTVISAL